MPDGAAFVAADRADAAAYDAVRDQDWDAVVDVSWQPGFVRSALDALGARARHWTYVSSCSVYADQSIPGIDESAALLPALDGDEASREEYGEAKVACERIASSALGDRLLVARSGLIAGPGDGSDRVGAWVARFALAVDEGGPVLVPDAPDQPVQAVDVRDLAGWLVRSAEAGVTGVYNASGPVLRFGDLISMSRSVAGHTDPVVLVDSDWLAAQKVEEFMGPESVALWMHDPEWAGFSARDTTAAVQAGLATRPLAQTIGRHVAVGARTRSRPAAQGGAESRAGARAAGRVGQPLTLAIRAWSARPARPVAAGLPRPGHRGSGRSR